MSAVTIPDNDAKQSCSEGQAFLDSLPVYRLAMHFAAVNMADLNVAGSPRTQAMDWWVSDDEGISQVGQIAEFIGRFHEELMRLPGIDEADPSIGTLDVLTDKAGQRINLSDLTSREEVVGLMRMSAGIWEELDGGRLLCDTGRDREARSMSAAMMKEACDRVCVYVQQRFSPQAQTPMQPAATRSPVGHNLTPSL